MFQAWPIVKSLWLSFFITAGPKNSVFVGTSNFQYLLKDPDFWIAVKNTATFAFWSVVLQLPLALALATVILTKPRKV